jgi:cobalt-zinc-cadmium efflux system protein
MGAGHDHLHGHHHGHDHHGLDHSTDHGHQRTAGAAFRWSIALNSGLTALQLAIGFGFGSLALIGDALHNLGDVIGLVLGWGAERLSLRPPQGQGRFTYGYGRSTQMASLINGLLIFSAGVVVVVEAIQRLANPVPLIAGPVVWAAAAGIVINLFSARLFGPDHHHDLNQRAAVLHLLTDAAVSVAVLISAIVVGLTGWLWLDAITAIGVGAAVIWSATGLLREAIALNLDAAPRGVDLGAVESLLQQLPGVAAVEELHVWGISTARTALTAHLLINTDQLSSHGWSREQLLTEAREQLARLGIRKCTIELEARDRLSS